MYRVLNLTIDPRRPIPKEAKKKKKNGGEEFAPFRVAPTNFI